MRFPSRFPCRLRRRFGAAIALALAGAVVACGPEFPNSYYDMPERELLRAPEGSFAAEIARIAAEVSAPARIVKDVRSTAEIEMAELRQALAAQGMPAARARGIEAGYEHYRRELEAWTAKIKVAPPGDPKAEKAPELVLPDGLPVEFAAYLRGATSWHRGEWREACQQWGEIAGLPEEARRHRSTWVAFMVGRAWLKILEHEHDASAAEEAVRCFRWTRELAAKGFADPLGLAAASLGWEARTLLRARDFAGAIELYLQHHAAGDESALASLRMTAEQAAHANEGSRAALAANGRARRVLTTYFISRFDGRWRGEAPPEPLRKWAGALRDAGVRNVPDADRLAWLAYDAGEFPLAWEWIALAAEDVPEAQWLRAKLALRGGDLQRGERLLRAALMAGKLSEPHRERVAAELARVCLARDDFAGALAAALAGGHWEDAAFVAERVMTAAELKKFVDAPPALAPKKAEPGSDGDRRGWRPADMPVALRHLLARRLARMGKGEAAAAYFPVEHQAAYTEYLAGIQRGFDAARPAAERAAGFWRAAQIAREHGMALLGTELEPDWAIWGGDFAMSSSAERRRRKDDPPAKVFLPSALEGKRLEEQPVPEKRFHYRYRAAELAWWAASLLPNDADETAEILATAGGWLKNRDPEAAKPFYQALVIRCGATGLGRAAAKARWFPKTAIAANAEP